jgi:O-glycosyl hydrolase
MQSSEQLLNTGRDVLPKNALKSAPLPTRAGLTQETVSVQNQSFSQAERVTVPATPGSETNAIQFTVNTIGPVTKGDVLLFVLSGRSANNKLGQLMVMFEQNHTPWTKSATQGVALSASGSWKRIVVPFVAQVDYASGEAMASIRLAFGAQVVELADMRVVNFEKKKTLAELQNIATMLSPLGTVAVSLNKADKRQVMVGLGGNYMGAWRAAYSEPGDPVEKYTLANLAPAHTRLGLSLVLWAPKADGKYNPQPKTDGMLKLAGDLTKKKIGIVVSIWEAADWMTQKQSDKKIIPEARWDDLVRALVAFLTLAKNKYNAQIDYFSFNEPDLGIDIYFTPERMAALVKKAVPTFARAGFKTKWLAGDTANGHNCAAYARTMLSDAEARPHLGPVAFHNWDALGASAAEYVAIAKVGSDYKHPIWCLEAGYDAQAWQIEPPVWPTWDNALKLAQAYLFTMQHAQASVMDYWTYSDNYAVATREGKPYPAAEVLQALGQAFDKGTQVIGSSSNRDELLVLVGIKPDGKMVVALVNTGGVGEVKLTNLPPIGRVIYQAFTEESHTMSANKRTVYVIHKGAITPSVPARSVVILTLPSG